MADDFVIKPSDFNLTSNTLKQESQELNYENLNLQHIEKMLVNKALDKHQGNISKAAKELGLTRAATAGWNLWSGIELFDYHKEPCYLAFPRTLLASS